VVASPTGSRVTTIFALNALLVTESVPSTSATTSVGGLLSRMRARNVNLPEMGPTFAAITASNVRSSTWMTSSTPGIHAAMLTAARWQMELSLGFHMIFSAVGMAMPLMMLIAEGRWLRTGDQAAQQLAKTWAKVTALLFAVGAVSGTALSFELGLLWPHFMAF